MEQSESENVDRGRIVDDYKHSIIQSVEHDEMKHGDTAVEREQYNERSQQLDENEATAKEQYDNNHCEEVTGLSSDGYRHQAIEDYTHEQMAGNAASENRDYWNDLPNDTSADNLVVSQSEDYWSGQSAGADAVEKRENELSNERSC